MKILGGLVAAALMVPSSMAWMPSSISSTRTLSTSSLTMKSDADDDNLQQRRQFLESTALSSIGMFTLFSNPNVANALVKGNAPPPKKSAGGEKPKCTNVEECQAAAEIREQELRENQEQGPPPQVTKSGLRYRDLEDGSGDLELKDGDDVEVYYKVLKLGKRSYDGLSGEGTVVFSRGYGLEDDEDKAGSKSFITTVGGFSNIIALNEALLGMKVGGIRRFSIRPQQGWEKATKLCDGGPGGGGAGGDVRTDYVVVPTATMVQQESCFDMSKQPFPTSYAQQRRMAQRFDQSLIMEVQVVKVKGSS